LVLDILAEDRLVEEDNFEVVYLSDCLQKGVLHSCLVVVSLNFPHCDVRSHQGVVFCLLSKDGHNRLSVPLGYLCYQGLLVDLAEGAHQLPGQPFSQESPVLLKPMSSSLHLEM
jgi:hypothetical protein